MLFTAAVIYLFYRSSYRLRGIKMSIELSSYLRLSRFINA
jgi:hypothetical protein